MLACGCPEKFITDVTVGVNLADALSVGCPCCGAPSGHQCGLTGTARNGVRWGDVCPARISAFVNHGEQLHMEVSARVG